MCDLEENPDLMLRVELVHIHVRPKFLSLRPCFSPLCLLLLVLYGVILSVPLLTPLLEDGGMIDSTSVQSLLMSAKRVMRAAGAPYYT